MTERLPFHFSLSCTGEGNGNPLRCSCLENPRDGGAWWTSVYGVAQSRTRLKRLSSRSSSRTELSKTWWQFRVQWTSQVALVVKNPPTNSGDTRDVGWIPGSGRSPAEGNGNPLQLSCLGNSLDRGTWQATVHGSWRIRHNWVTEHASMQNIIINIGEWSSHSWVCKSGKWLN